VAARGKGVGLSPPAKCRLAPTVKQTGQEPGGQFCGHFHIFVVSGVKICKQRLQTASAFPKSPTWPSLLDPHCGTSVPEPPGLWRLHSILWWRLTLTFALDNSPGGRLVIFGVLSRKIDVTAQCLYASSRETVYCVIVVIYTWSHKFTDLLAGLWSC